MFTSQFISPATHWNAVADRIRQWQREPDMSGATAFDTAQWGDISLSPNRPSRLFGYEERNLGQPSDLFASLAAGGAVQVSRTSPLRNWRNMIDRLKPYSVRGQVAGVHTYINQMNGAADDVATLARSKPWSGVLNCSSWPGPETGKALAKYVSLRFLGFHPDRLRLVLADTLNSPRNPVVLVVFFGGKAFVLGDGNNDGGITTDDRLPDFRPGCSLNARQFYLHWAANSNDSPAEAATRLLNQFGLAAA